MTRVALVPHVCVVATVLALPYGELQASRRWLVAAAAATAALAGAGADLPVLALLGVVLAISGFARLASGARAPEVTATGLVEVALAAAFIALELLGADRLSLRTTADALDVVLALAAIAVTVTLGREPMAPDDLTAELGRRVAAVLGVPSVEVSFRVEDGTRAVDTHGRRIKVHADSAPIRAADGAVVAFVSPSVSMTWGTEQALAQRLLPLADACHAQRPSASSERRARPLAQAPRGGGGPGTPPDRGVPVRVSRCGGSTRSASLWTRAQLSARRWPASGARSPAWSTGWTHCADEPSRRPCATAWGTVSTWLTPLRSTHLPPSPGRLGGSSSRR